ncbi:hypothetical protein K438DRAFT_1765307 [Mycena galopus ATCC 62051]|nr:hypothetical protein K438DRAFT_1765307 [Mycena galopus ATCC 62051]
MTWYFGVALFLGTNGPQAAQPMSSNAVAKKLTHISVIILWRSSWDDGRGGKGGVLCVKTLSQMHKILAIQTHGLGVIIHKGMSAHTQRLSSNSSALLGKLHYRNIRLNLCGQWVNLRRNTPDERLVPIG